MSNQRFSKPWFWLLFGLLPKLANFSHFACQIYDKIFYLTLVCQIFDVINFSRKPVRPIVFTLCYSSSFLHIFVHLIHNSTMPKPHGLSFEYWRQRQILRQVGDTSSGNSRYILKNDNNLIRLPPNEQSNPSLKEENIKPLSLPRGKILCLQELTSSSTTPKGSTIRFILSIVIIIMNLSRGGECV